MIKKDSIRSVLLQSVKHENENFAAEIEKYITSYSADLNVNNMEIKPQKLM